MKSPAGEIKPTVWSHTFSVDDENLLLWACGGGHIFASVVTKYDQPDVIETCHWKEYIMPEVMFVTGSKGRIAAVSEVCLLSGLMDRANSLSLVF
jgi:hypothetical protein